MVTPRKVIAIVGPTASGKTGLALQLAQKVPAEIICADSRTIYRGMDIGTAKPSLEEQGGVPHHLLDILNPDQPYSAAEFKNDANRLMQDIESRSKLPVVVGGTGLYVTALLYDYEFPAGADNTLRKELEQKELTELQDELRQRDPEAYKTVDTKNKRRVIRAIETIGQPRSRNNRLPENCLLLGLNPSMEELEKRIQKRTKQMLGEGLVSEVKSLANKYGKAVEPLQTVGYREVIEYIEGRHTLEETEQLINLHTRQLAKRQLTWFKRNKDIVWFPNAEQAIAYIGSPTL